jgi:hypothetical protein
MVNILNGKNPARRCCEAWRRFLEQMMQPPRLRTQDQVSHVAINLLQRTGNPSMDIPGSVCLSGAGRPHRFARVRLLRDPESHRSRCRIAGHEYAVFDLASRIACTHSTCRAVGREGCEYCRSLLPNLRELQRNSLLSSLEKTEHIMC